VASTTEGVSRSDLRRFGLSVGGVFLVLAALSRWRGHEIAPLVMASAGVLLVVPGLLAPGVLEPVRRGWLRGAAVIGDVNARVLLTVLYYLVVAPIGFVMRWRRDPLDRALDDGRTSQWIRRPVKPLDRASYERQF
jgi:hypothetical protein